MKPADVVTLTVYSRNDWQLCEEMITALQELQGRFCFALRVVNIDADPAPKRGYGEKVPVLAHGERELCHAILDRAAVTAPLPEFR